MLNPAGVHARPQRWPAPIALVGFKAYFSHARTLEWFTALERLVAEGRTAGVGIVVLPSATSLAVLAGPAGRLGVRLGAQDCSAYPAGPYTGELPVELLREIGAVVAEVGHAERRRLLGETDDVVARKVAAAVAGGLTPFLCVGETAPGPARTAAREVCAQLAAATRSAPGAPVLVGYEPEWAIGARHPAPKDHVIGVCHAVRGWLDEHAPGSRVLYGGTAGPGMYRDLAGALDGLALGRRVHDPEQFALVLDEMRAEPSATLVPRTAEGWWS